MFLHWATPILVRTKLLCDLLFQTLILFCHEHMSVREEQYPEPHSYIPERWLVDQDHPLYHGNAHPNAAVHFGYGARGCVGKVLYIFFLQYLDIC